MIAPDMETARALARNGNVIPLSAAILADTETPVSVWMKLFRDREGSFLLESVTGGDQVARYSFIGGEPFMTFRANGRDWEIAGKRSERGSGDPIGKLRELMAAYNPVRIEGLPRFCGGGVGFFTYDSIRLWENIPDGNPGDGTLDEISFGFYRDLIAFDNREHKLLLISNIFTDDHESFEDAYKEARFRIGNLMDRMAVRLSASTVSVKQIGDVSSSVPRKHYEQAVERCKEYIRAGDVFQVVLSQRFSVEVEADPFDLYRILRTVNPSPYMYYLSRGDAHVIGASPEMLVRVEDGTVEVRPIAGTRWRGKTDEEDEQLAAELLADPKERAEHVMLVDLGRNDVGRVSEKGSVHVENMMHIEKYSHVMHIVSDVKGRLRSDRDAFDALYSCFPAGTLSGAPKIRAMEIIDEQETLRRGLYGGALGYMDFGGNLDTCIVIRTIVYQGARAGIQVGAGIVADSEPSREYEETVHKAQALFTAVRDAGRIVGMD